MRWRNTIAAGLVFVALLAWVITNERHRVPEKEEVFGIDAAQVTALSIQRKGEEPITLERRGEDWFLTQPFTGLASNDEAGRLVKEIAELVPRSTREGIDLQSEDFGLTDAELVATLTYAGNKQATIHIGAETPMGSERYAKVSGARTRGGDDLLYVVSSSLRTSLWRDPKELREKKVARFEADDVTQVALEHGETQVVAVRRAAPEEASETAKWALSAPLATAADEWSVKQVINNVRDLRAEGFVEEAKSDAELGLDKPQAVVTLTLSDGRTLTISLGKTAEAEVGEPPTTKQIIYARTSEREEVLMLAADALDKVRKTAFDLRDKSVLRLARDDVTRIVVERRQGLSFTVARRPDGWFVEKPKAFTAQRSKIDDILWDLEDLTAVKFVTEQADQAKLREYGLAVPQVAITIHLKSGEQLRVLIGNQTEDRNYYAKTGASDQVVVISQFLFNDLPTKVEELEQTEPDFDQQFPQDTGTPEGAPPPTVGNIEQ